MSAATGERPPRLGQAHRGSSPYQLFETQDGNITVGASQPNFWMRLCEILDLVELPNDPRFATNGDRVRNNDALVQCLQARFKTQPSAHWLSALEKAGIPAGPVLSFDQAMADPQIVAREMVVETEHPAAGKFRTLGIPAKLSATPGALRRPAPRLGEHTEEVIGGTKIQRKEPQGKRRRKSEANSDAATGQRYGEQEDTMLTGRFYRTAAIVAASLAAISAAAADEPGVTADTIKIGTFGALTGPGYLYGKLPMNGVEVVFDEVNTAGGINGRKLELVREDDRCDPAAAIGAVKKLIHQDKVFAIIGGGCSNATFAAREAWNRAKVPRDHLRLGRTTASRRRRRRTSSARRPPRRSRARPKSQFALDQGAKKIADHLHARLLGPRPLHAADGGLQGEGHHARRRRGNGARRQ